MVGVRAVVVGSLNVDLVLDVPALPGSGETILGFGVQRLPGGKGANQAVALARLGVHTTMVGAVGSDPEADLLRATLNAEGVDTRFLQIVGGPSGLAVVTVDRSGANHITVIPGANGQLTDPVAPDGDVLLVQQEIPERTVAAALLRPYPLKVLNAAPARALSAETLSCVDVLVVNQAEAAALAADVSPEEAVRGLCRRGPSTVVVTLGGEGSLVGYGDRVAHVPAHRVPVVDTTGAGDAYVAALACALAEGADPVAAARFATSAAALAVGVLGAQAGLPSRERVRALQTT